MHDELNQSTLTLGPAYCGRFTRLSSYSISGAGPNQHIALGRVTKNYEVAVSRHFDDRPPARQGKPTKDHRVASKKHFSYKRSVNEICVKDAKIHSRDETVLVHWLFPFALRCLRPHLQIPDCQHPSSTNSRLALACYTMHTLTSFTFSKTMLQCLSNAFTLARSFLLFRSEIST